MVLEYFPGGLLYRRIILFSDRLLDHVTETEWNNFYEKIEEELLSKYSNNIQYYVCGKNFLLGLLILKMKSITDHREKNILIKQSLARNTSLKILRNELGTAI